VHGGGDDDGGLVGRQASEDLLRNDLAVSRTKLRSRETTINKLRFRLLTKEVESGLQTLNAEGAPPFAEFVAGVMAAEPESRGDCTLCGKPVLTSQPRLRLPDGQYAHQHGCPPEEDVAAQPKAPAKRLKYVRSSTGVATPGPDGEAPDNPFAGISGDTRGDCSICGELVLDTQPRIRNEDGGYRHDPCPRLVAAAARPVANVHHESDVVEFVPAQI